MDINYYKNMYSIEDIKEVCLSDKHVLKIKSEITKNGMLDRLINLYSFFSNKSISQIIWHLKNDIYDDVKCCCQNSVRYVDINKGYVKYCSNKCQLNDYWSNISNEEIERRIIKTKKTCKEKYGVENFNTLDIIKEKTKTTNNKKYNSDYHLKTDKSKQMIKDNLNDKYGVDNVSKLEYVKIKKKNKSLLKTDEEKLLIREKYKNTILERYGVEHLSQDSDFLEELLKKSFSYKSHRLPSGKVISLQGYEPKVIDYLLKYYDEDDILYTNKSIENKIGKIFYQNIDKVSRYFPDLYIISKNKIVEVKSTFTYDLDIVKNMSKKEECLKRGINFDFIIYDNINNNFIIK